MSFLKHQISLSLLALFLLSGQLLYAQTGAAQATTQHRLRSAILPLRVIDKETLRGMAANNLAEALRFELNVELEQAPEIGGSRPRAADLNSRYTKILLDGIPVSGSDMFGGHVDISAIPLNRIERVEISPAPLGTEYGSGTLAMVVNVVTLPDFDNTPTGTSAYASLYEQTVADEYNLKTGHGAKGRHVQQLGVQHYSTNGIFFGADLQRDAFKGWWGDYAGSRPQSDYTNRRGYAWSPTTSLNGNAFVGYRRQQLSLLYRYGISNMEVPVYGHVNDRAYVDGEFQDFYTATDQENRYRRQHHHLQMKAALWQTAALAIDIAYQDADTRKRSKWVRTADNTTLAPAPLIMLYGARTWYSKGTLDMPLISGILDWTVGYEADWSKVFTAAQPGTYTTREIDKEIFQLGGFTYLHGQLSSTLTAQPGIRIAYQHRGSHLLPLPSLSLSYAKGRHRLGLVGEKVHRFANQRELFTYLDSEFNLLQGNTDLRPERGLALLADWTYNVPAGGDLHVQTRVSSGYRRLKDRIIVAAIPQTDPRQERYQYANRQQHQSWANRAEAEASTERWHMQVAYSLLGLRGNDFSDSKQYDRFLFHSEVAASARYKVLQDYWVQLNYRFVGRQPLYSFERIMPNPEIIRVHNRAPAFHLMDIHIGTKFLTQSLSITTGVRNLFGAKAIDFEATDGQDHYRGDLRTIHMGYGRSFMLRVGYQL